MTACRVLEIIPDNPPTWAQAALPAERVAQLLGLVDVNWLDRSDLPVQPITYRAVVVPNDPVDLSRSVPLLAGFVPPDPARAAEAERTRGKGREHTAPLTPGCAPVPLDAGRQNGMNP